MDALKRFVKDEEGQTMAEYALLGALIAVVVIVAIPALSTAIMNTFGDISTALTPA